MKDIDRSVTVPVDAQPALGTVVNSDLEILRDDGSAAAAFLAGAPGVAEDCAPTSLFRFVGDHPLQFTPGRQANIPPQTSEPIYDHVFDVQIFKNNDITFVNQLPGDNIKLCFSGPFEIKPSSGNDLTSFFTTAGTFLFSREVSLSFTKFAFGPDCGLDVAHDFSIRCGDEIGKSEIDADLAASCGQWLDCYFGADETCVPTISLAGDGNSFEFSRELAPGCDLHLTNIRNIQPRTFLIIFPATVFEFQSIPSFLSFKSGETWLLTTLHTSKERFESTIKLLEYGFQELTINQFIFRDLLSQWLDLVGLSKISKRLSTISINKDPLFQCSIVEGTCRIKKTKEKDFLCLIWSNSELIGTSKCHNILILNKKYTNVK